MARLTTTTVGAYVEQYLRSRFCQNHMIWLQGTESEVIEVLTCNHPKLFRIIFADDTETIVDCNAICYVQIIPGTVKNW